jgi:hypothetical protein
VEYLATLHVCFLSLLFIAVIFDEIKMTILFPFHRVRLLLAVMKLPVSYVLD